MPIHRSCLRLIVFAILVLVTLHLSAGTLDVCVADANVCHERTALSDGWTFSMPGCAETNVSVPHTWNTDDAYDDAPGYIRTVGTYRRTLSVSSVDMQSCLSLLFMGSNQLTKVYVNDQLAGSHAGGYTRFIVDIHPYIHEGDNELRVEVSNEHNPDIPPLSADYTFFGGIYRNVYLLREPLQHFAHPYATEGIFLTPYISDASRASLYCAVHLDNADCSEAEVRLKLSLSAPDRKAVASLDTLVVLPAFVNDYVFETTFDVDHPQLWSPASPRLYEVQTQMSADSSTSSHSTKTGFRWFNFSEEGFTLNGSPLKLMGTNRHQCLEGKGWALSEDDHVTDIQAIRAMGSNFLRVSHYPQDPAVMDACDSLGLLTSVEVPIVNAITPSEAFAENSLQMTREMVMQDYNHPSVILWAYMNEVMLRTPYAASDSIHYPPYIAALNRLASQIEDQLRHDDPTRKTLLPMHGAYQTYHDAGLTQRPDVLGFNLYNGWYGGKISDFGAELDRLHKAEPGRPLFVTEYGADNDARLHTFLPERFDYTAEYAETFHRSYLADIEMRPFVVGATVWNYNDFASEERGNALPHLNCKGLVEYNRRPKSTYHLYEAALSSQPRVFISSRHWQHRSGVLNADGVCLQPVDVYSNCKETRLFVNGQELKPQGADRAFVATILHYQMPLHAGRNILQAFASDGTKDECNIDFIPASPDYLHVMLGSSRYFVDSDSICWVPDQPYSSVAGWGYEGGEAFRVKTWFGSQPSADANIRGTQLDPLFQTAREGITTFRADVPDGNYNVTFYLAELRTAEEQAKLAYNLGNDAITEDFKGREMSIRINGKRVVNHLNLTQQAGYATALTRSFPVKVRHGKGLRIEFQAHTGTSLLNAISIVRR